MNYRKAIKQLLPPKLLNVITKLLHKIEIKKEKKAYENGEIEKKLKSWYKIRTGENLDLSNPLSLTEKQQWIKVRGVTKK